MPVSDILSALADENRRRILTALKQGRVSSGELAQAVGMTPQRTPWAAAPWTAVPMLVKRSNNRKTSPFCFMSAK